MGGNRRKLGYGKSWMLQRLLPLMLAVVIGATPIAREMCQISCEEHHAGSAPASSPHGHQHAGHSMAGHEMPDHEMDVPDTGDSQLDANRHSPVAAPSRTMAMSSCEMSLSAGRHGCGHGDESQAASVTVAKLVIDAPAVVPQLVDSARVLATEVPAASVGALTLRPIPISSRTPLRV